MVKVSPGLIYETKTGNTPKLQYFKIKTFPTLQMSELGSFLQAPRISLASSKLNPLSCTVLADFLPCKCGCDYTCFEEISTFNMLSVVKKNIYVESEREIYIHKFNAIPFCYSHFYFSHTSSIYLSSNRALEELHQVLCQSTSLIRENVLHLSNTTK